MTVAVSACLAPQAHGGPAVHERFSAALTSNPRDINVGTWNVVTVTADATVGNQTPWKVREPVIVDDIVKSDLDVLGVQEVSPSPGWRKHLLHGRTQYADLLRSLNLSGVRYRLTQTRVHASLNNRILYKPRKLRLVDSGSLIYRHQRPHHTRRGVTWAIFRVKATGKRFLFTNTHLEPHDFNVRPQQARELVRLIKDLQRGHRRRPVIAVGDWNEDRCWSRHNVGHRLTRAGMPSVLQGEPCYYGGSGGLQTQPLRPDAWRNIWVGSYNHFVRYMHHKRNCLWYADEDPDPDTLPIPCVGFDIDRIFVTARLRIPYYEVVADLNADKSALVGTIPSDHYLIKATVRLR